MKVRSKLLLVVLLPAIVFITSLSVFLSVLTKDYFLQYTNRHLETAASNIKEYLNFYFQENIKHLEIIVENTKKDIFNYQDEGNEEDLEVIVTDLKNSLSKVTDAKRICFFEKNGDITISTNPAFIGRNGARQDFFKQGLIGSGLYFAEIDGNLELLFTTPVEQKGRVAGVMVLVFDLEGINEIANQRAGLGDTGEVLLAINTDAGPKFISERRFKYDDEFSVEQGDDQELKNKAQPMKLALQGKEELIPSSLDYRGEEVVATTRFFTDYNLGLVAKIDESEVLINFNNLTKARIIATLAIFASFALLINIFSKKMVKPIVDLKSIAEKVTQGDFNQEVATVKRKDEVGMLTKAFKQMLSKIKESKSEIEEKVDQQTTEIQSKAKDLEKQRLAIMNVLEDVEVEKRIAQEKSQELQKYQLAVENVSDHIVITDAEGTILFFNPAAEKITGFSEEEVLGQKVGTNKNWGGLMEEADYQAFWKAIKKDKKVFAGEFKNKRKSGEEYLAEASVAPILNQNGEVAFFVGIERDVTKIREVDRMKTEFISLASHQLRTPLSAIKWFLEMLLAGDAGKLNKEQLEFVNNINDSNERMIELVNSLLNVSRIESGRIIIDPEPTNLKKLVDQVVLELQPKIKEKKHEIIISSHQDLPEINVDPKLISNVYLNLISNAVKYTPDKGEINIFISKDGEKIISQVSDNGFGIPKDQQGSIFNKFFRASNVAKVDTTGNGLGLYLVKAIINSSGGEIWFESEKDKGTSFFFSLPLEGSSAKEGEVSIS